MCDYVDGELRSCWRYMLPKPMDTDVRQSEGGSCEVLWVTMCALLGVDIL